MHTLQESVKIAYDEIKTLRSEFEDLNGGIYGALCEIDCPGTTDTCAGISVQCTVPNNSLDRYERLEIVIDNLTAIYFALMNSDIAGAVDQANNHYLNAESLKAAKYDDGI